MNRTDGMKKGKAWLKAAIFAAFCFLAAVIHAADVEDTTASLSRIELEVKLLRAQMALVDGHRAVARTLLESIEPQLAHYPAYQARWQTLMNQLGTHPSSSTADLSADGPPPFRCTDPYVALLPLSGPLGKAGQALVEGLKAANCVPLDTLDTALFDAEALQQMVALYRPAWVLGPLRANMIQAWVEQAPTWPTLLLGRNRSETPCTHCMALSMRPLDQLLQGGWLETVPTPRRILVPERFEEAVPASMRMQGDVSFYSHALAEHLRTLLGVQASVNRSRYLQHVLRHPVESVPRARVDLQAIVLLGSLAEAQQAAALLQFWQVPSRFIWLPTRLSHSLLQVFDGSSWPPMVALLPPFVWQVQEDSFETGMFRALGESVAKRLQTDPAVAVMTPLGRMLWRGETLNVTFVPYVHRQGRRWRPLVSVPTDD